MYKDPTPQQPCSACVHSESLMGDSWLHCAHDPPPTGLDEDDRDYAEYVIDPNGTCEYWEGVKSVG